ncbi:hypothetical protein LTR28_004640 [Elasticomyces elasticus]|nr:hypothetical protein LTR28_004640 [Elasticomyces elasticus]
MSFFQAEKTPRPKCYFTHNALPAYIDEKQPPTKRKPFSSIIAQPFSHTVGLRILCCVDRTNAWKVDLLLPAELYDTIREKLHGDACALKYARVNMKLGELIEGDFFNHYIKTGPISTHHPVVQTISPIATRTPNTKTPTFPTTIKDDDEATATDLAEWLGLALLASPRIAADDKIDPYLSRYALPDLIGGDDENKPTANPQHTVEHLIRLTWHGFATAPFLASLFTTAVKASVGEAWFALSVSGFRDEAYLVLKTGRTAMVWEYP